MTQMSLKLSGNEIRDIIKCLEAGKHLPEKYRFLLFEDKREVVLVWNGKTGEEVNVLPFQVIEQVYMSLEPKMLSNCRQKCLTSKPAGRLQVGTTTYLGC
jgi:hypothetical protein